MAKNKQKTESISRKSLSARAYESIYHGIITLAHEPGMHLEEGPLVDKLGIGRTPVREALQRLAADLLVESQPGKGFLVRPLTLQNTKAAFTALRILELGVAGLAVRKEVGRFIEGMEKAGKQVETAVKKMDIYRLVEANSVFHDMYAKCSHNIYLVEGLRKVRCETNRLAYLSYGNEINPGENLQEHYASVIGQHAGMIDAIRNRDESLLKQIIIDHIETFKDRIVNYLMSF